MEPIATFFRRMLNEETATRLAAVLAEVAFLLLLLWFVRRFVNRLMTRFIDRAAERGQRLGVTEAASARLRTLGVMLSSVVSFVLVFVFAIMILQTMSVNVTGLLTTAGIGGLAIGFGAQKLVKDTISGFFIVMDGQFAVGDYVTIGSVSGFVVELNMRVTRIRDDQGREWTLANGDISTVTNHSCGPVTTFIDVPFNASASVSETRSEIDALGASLFQSDPGALLEAWRSAGLCAYDGASLTVRVAIRARPGFHAAEQFRAREALREHFRKKGVLPLAPVPLITPQQAV